MRSRFRYGRQQEDLALLCPRGWDRPPRQTTKAMPPQTQDQPAPNSDAGNVDKLVQQRFFLIRRTKAGSLTSAQPGPTTSRSALIFASLGWRVIGIEPNPKFYEQHKSRAAEVHGFACGGDRAMRTTSISTADHIGAQYQTAREFPTNRSRRSASRAGILRQVERQT